jgi:hypothetical protein
LPGRTWEQSQEWIKICPSNPGVADQVIKNWLPRKEHQKYISVCCDDGDNNFCECKACRDLDVLKPGEKFGDNTTDRYVYLANAVARKARRIRSDAHVTMHAYLSSVQPPRKQKLEPNVVVLIVPYVLPMDIGVVSGLMEGWREAGAKTLSFRPNFHYKYMASILPIGIEKRMFDIFKLAYDNGAVSMDYDALMENWAVTGLADYVLAQAFTDPDKPFEYWENQYCEAFGPAAADVKEYFRYWRDEVFEKRLSPNLKHIVETGRYGNFVRGLYWSLEYKGSKRFKPRVACDQYYEISDFDKTDAILQKALSRDLTEDERKRVEQLKFANEQARLFFRCITTRGPDKFKHSKKLMAWRRKHSSDYHSRFVPITKKIPTGLVECEALEEYDLPWIATPISWKFKIDPSNRGMKDKWYAPSYDVKDWKNFRIDLYWSNPHECPWKKLKKRLKTYDGIGWYAFSPKIPAELKGRKIYLRFGGVDDSCWVYVNGKKAGEHVWRKKGDENVGFAIRIDPFIDWNLKHQQIRVRVKDSKGKGGLHSKVWIVSKK